MTFEEMRDWLIKARDAKYESKLVRNGARLTAIETVLLKLLHELDYKVRSDQIANRNTNNE